MQSIVVIGLPVRDSIAGTLTPFADNLFAPVTTQASSQRAGASPVDTAHPAPDVHPADPNTFNRGSLTDKSAGHHDIAEVIDGQAGPRAQATASGGSGLVSADDVVHRLNNIRDCKTGKRITVRFDDHYPLPEGWAHPDTPPADAGYQAGYYWYNVYGYPAAPSPEAAQQAFLAEFKRQNGRTHVQPAGITYVTATQITLAIYDAGVTRQHFYTTYYRAQCSAGVITAYCPAAPPTTVTTWPTDGTYELAIIDGQFAAHTLDSDAPDDAGGSSIDVCFAKKRHARLYVTAHGGALLVETQGPGGAPTGVARVYNSNGSLQAAGDATSAFIAQYLPQ